MKTLAARQWWAGIFVALLGCASPALRAARHPADNNNLPSEAEMRQQMMGLLGKSENPQEPADESGVRVVIQTGHAAPITAVGESGDGRWVVSGGMDETLKVWDVASGQEARTISGQGLLWPRAIAVGDDGTLAVVTDYTSARIYDLKAGLLQRQLWTRGNSLPLASRDASWLVGEFTADALSGPSSHDASTPGLQVLEARTGRVAWKVPADAAARSLALSGSGRWLITATPSQRASGAAQPTGEWDLWELGAHRHAGHCNGAVLATQDNWIAALSDDGRMLALESPDRDTLQLFDTADCRVVRTVSTEVPATGGPTTTLAFSPDGTQVAWAVSGGVSHLWRVVDGSPVDAPQATALQWRTDGAALVYGHGAGGAPVVRDVSTGEDNALAAGASEIADLDLSSDGGVVLAAMQDGAARLWDLATAEVRRTFDCAAGVAASAVAIDRQGSHVALGCADGSATLWSMQEQQASVVLLPSAGKDYEPVMIRFAADGHTLVAARRDELTVLDARTGAVRRRFTVPPAEAGTGATESPDPAAEWIRAIALHPTDPLVAVGQARAITLWNYATGERVAELHGAGILEKMGLGNLQGMGAGGMGMPLGGLQSMSITGAHSLAFAADGARLVSVGPMGRQVWDIRSAREITPPSSAASAKADPRHGLDGLMGMLGGGAAGGAVGGRGVSLSPDGRLAAQGIGHRIRVFDVATLENRADLEGHTADVTALAWSRDGATLVSGGKDGSIRLWDARAQKERVALIALGPLDSIAVTPEHYYRASRSRLQGVAFRTGGVLYPFDQFDLRFNRPDLVLTALGRASPDLVKSYRYAYERRLKRMGFSEQMLLKDFHLPEIHLLTAGVPVTTATASLSLAVAAQDAKVPLDRFMAYVNDVPVYGRAGRAIAGAVHDARTQLDVPLVAGRNKIQVSVLNRDGIESLRQTLYTTLTTPEPPRDVWVVAIGVSHYRNSRYDLRYAAKDATDLAGVFGTHAGQAFHLLTITDDKATRDGVRAARQWLANARTGDLVVVFAAGHGMTDADQNYYFGTYDIDPNDPARAGLPFDDFESLLDGIAPLRKLLLVDTCFSGEIDRDEAVRTGVDTPGVATPVTVRAFKAMRGIQVTGDEARPDAGASLPAYARFQQDWFADLRRGTGAVVVSSASGNEFALEGEAWKNGVFTYAVIDGLKNGKADANADGTVTATELEAYVIRTVRELTAGKQNPTVRRENVDFDFGIY